MKYDITSNINNEFILTAYDLADDIWHYIDQHVSDHIEPELEVQSEIYHDYQGGKDVEIEDHFYTCIGNENGDFSYTLHAEKFGFDVEDVMLHLHAIFDSREILRYGSTKLSYFNHTDAPLYYYIKLDTCVRNDGDVIEIECEWVDK